MKLIDLWEYKNEECELKDVELNTLFELNDLVETLFGGKKRLLDISPVKGKNGCYNLKPNSIVCAMEADNLSLQIKPKIDNIEPKIDNIPLMWLACYAMNKVYLPESFFKFANDKSLTDSLALYLNILARRAFARGLLHGYRTQEEALYTVRGRIRFDEQIRRRFNVPLPIEVSYDEFTEDILANQLVKAAAYRLRGMRSLSTPARQGLARVAGILDNVSPVEFPRNAVPEVQFDRLNEHYRGVVGLSRLILRHSAFQSGRGAVRANWFLMDMNEVFQEFVTQALREALGVPEWEFGEKEINSLDEGGKVGLRPDLTWWEDDVCRFVGDVKYKIDYRRDRERRNRNRNDDDRNLNDDLYQLLAYVTALDLPGGMLIYAKGEANPYEYRVRHAGKTLEVFALNLQNTPENILEQVKDLADAVKALRDRDR